MVERCLFKSPADVRGLALGFVLVDPVKVKDPLCKVASDRPPVEGRTEEENGSARPASLPSFEDDIEFMATGHESLGLDMDEAPRANIFYSVSVRRSKIIEPLGVLGGKMFFFS